jgi:tetratricopeptide (TPR) repeat protein
MDEQTVNPKTRATRVRLAYQKLIASFRRITVKLSLRRVDQSLTRFTSIVFRLSILLFFVVAILYVYSVVTDDRFRVREFDVPERLTQKGYTGKVLAIRLNQYINNVIEGAKFTWSPKEIEKYDQISNDAQFQIEVAGFGFSPRSLINSISETFGGQTKDIKGIIIHEGDRVKLMVMLGSKSTTLERPIENGREDDAIDWLIHDAAMLVLRENNPLILGVLYAGRMSGDKIRTNDTTAIEMFQRVIRFTPDQAGTAYAWWASILVKRRDTLTAVRYLKKAFAHDPDNAFGYRVMANIKALGRNYAEAERLMRHSLELDETSASTWALLGRFYRDQNGPKDSEAIDCYKKAAALDPAADYEWNVIEMLVITGQIDEAHERMEARRDQGEWWGFADAYWYATLLKKRDTLQLKQALAETKRSSVDISTRLNSIAFRLEERDPDLSFKIVSLAIELDSTNAYAYTTLAELHGYAGRSDGFFRAFEKALQFGFAITDLNETSDEPYKRFVNDARYLRLKALYGQTVVAKRD